MTAHKRRITPADKADILREWLDKEIEYLDQGYSRHQAHLKIAKEYGCSSSQVYRWTRHRRGSAKNAPSRSYSEKIENPNFKRMHNFPRRFAYDPRRYIAPLFEGPGEAVTLEELSVRLESNHGYLPRLQTLDSLLVRPHPRTGAPVLEEVPDTEPTRYRLTTSG